MSRFLVTASFAAFSFIAGSSLSGAAFANDGATAGPDDGLATAVKTKREMVVSANPLASKAGARILRRGGTAADAMVAVQTVLGLVEPQSSGIGGGAFIVYYDAKTDTLTTIDAREKAPLSAKETRFLNAEGNSIGFFNAWQSGLSAGVPGVPAMMEFMQKRYGKLKWAELFADAKRLARRGYPLTERTSSQVAGLLARNASCSDRLFFRDPTAFNYFTNGDLVDCAAKPTGTIIKNPDYAKLMARLARKGADGFYKGHVAQAIVKAVQTDPNIPGDMTLKDLRKYNVVERKPVCVDYRGYEVCGMGPPSSGALAVGQILGVFENLTNKAGTKFDDPLDDEVVHFFTMAGRLAFADRGLYVGDSDFVTVPIKGMLDKKYLASRAALVGDSDIGTALPGEIDGFDPNGPAHKRAKNSGTSHVSIVDKYGNALSMTTTIESSFGNGVMTPGWGFLLNNELTDFAFTPVSADGQKIANRVQPGKRPRSSMSPTIVFDPYGELFLVTGSPGGSRIIGYTAQSIVNVIDFGLDPQQAINVPHFMNRNGSTDIETPIAGVTRDYDAEALQATLQEARGHTVRILTQTSGLSIIQVGDRHLIGGGDKRRDGTVKGR